MLMMMMKVRWTVRRKKKLLISCVQEKAVCPAAAAKFEITSFFAQPFRISGEQRCRPR